MPSDEEEGNCEGEPMEDDTAKSTLSPEVSLVVLIQYPICQEICANT